MLMAAFLADQCFILIKALVRWAFHGFGKVLAWYYAICIVIGSLGIAAMFQANQAYVQFVNVTGGEGSFFDERAWLFGVGLAVLTGLVIVGGIKSIAKVTSTLVPFMALLYLFAALAVIAVNIERLPWAIGAIIEGAFSPRGVTGGVIAVLILGFRRAAFSNEAGIGSSAVAHAAV